MKPINQLKDELQRLSNEVTALRDERDEMRKLLTDNTKNNTQNNLQITNIMTDLKLRVENLEAARGSQRQYSDAAKNGQAAARQTTDHSARHGEMRTDTY